MLVDSIRIGITDCARYANYERWLLDAPDKVDVVRLSYSLDNLDDLNGCQGLVLSGGEDVDPRRYKRPDLLGRVEFTDIDEKRDEFEIDVIKRALQLKLPILSICRGTQLFNVYHGGSLIYDIPSMLKISGHAKIQGIDQRHDVRVREKSLLYEITGCLKGAVNSAHHQCIDTLAPELIVAARAEEPIIEAIQWKNAKDHPFYLGVQWHPERMTDQDSPFAYNIRQAFLDYIIQRSDCTSIESDEETQTFKHQNIENKPPIKVQ